MKARVLPSSIFFRSRRYLYGCHEIPDDAARYLEQPPHALMDAALE